MSTPADDLLAACKAQHDAIDILFAMIIAATKPGEEPFYPSQSGRPWAALQLGNKAVKRAEAEGPPEEFTYEHLEAGACMWEHVLDRLRRVKVGTQCPWADYKAAYGMAQLREAVIRHAPVLDAEYQQAAKNGYDKPFDWEYVPAYMERYVTRILA